MIKKKTFFIKHGYGMEWIVEKWLLFGFIPLYTKETQIRLKEN